MTTGSGLPFVPVQMGDKEDWLFRPVAAKILAPESLINGAVDLEYVATLNEMLDVQSENQRRAELATRSPTSRGRR